MVTTVAQLADSIVCVRVGVEQPRHSAERLIDDVELRRYGPRIVAQTFVEGGEEAARSERFRGLAAYIFGGNPPSAWFYDPPWTLWFRRRNEIAIPV